MSTKTILNVRTDVKLKRAAQNAAKELGVPLSVVVNTSLRNFIHEQKLELEPLNPSKKLRRWIAEADKEMRSGKTKVFNSLEELFADLKAG